MGDMNCKVRSILISTATPGTKNSICSKHMHACTGCLNYKLKGAYGPFQRVIITTFTFAGMALGPLEGSKTSVTCVIQRKWPKSTTWAIPAGEHHTRNAKFNRKWTPRWVPVSNATLDMETLTKAPGSKTTSTLAGMAQLRFSHHFTKHHYGYLRWSYHGSYMAVTTIFVKLVK